MLDGWKCHILKINLLLHIRKLFSLVESVTYDQQLYQGLDTSARDPESH